MYFNRILRSRNSLGFSLIEIVTVLLIASVISAIAVPKYLSSKNKGNLSIAQSDGDNLFREIRDATMDVQTPGSTNGTITFDPSTGTMTMTLGTGGDTINPFTENVTPGTTVSGVTYANTYNWCIDVVNNAQHAIFNQDGYQPSLASCP